MLPVVPLATGTVEVGGTDVVIRSLSRSAVVSLAQFGRDTTAAEVFIVSKGTGGTEDEARAWLDSTDAETAGILLKAIAALSGIASGEPGDEPGEA
jgi:hypothetical protein